MIIGLGNIGFRYGKNRPNSASSLTHFQAISRNSNIELLCGLDSDLNICEEFEESTAVKTFSEVSENLAKYKPELVVLSTPTLNRLSHVEMILNSWKPKILVLEKPLGNNFEQSKSISTLLKRSGINIFVNYQRNYLQPFKSLKNQLIDPSNGSIVRVKGEYSGTLANSGSHLIAIFYYLFGPLRVPKFPTTKFSNEFIIQSENVDIQIYQLPKLMVQELSFEITTESSQYSYSSSRNELRVRSIVKSEDYDNEYYFDKGVDFCDQYELKNGLDMLYKEVVRSYQENVFQGVSHEIAFEIDKIVNEINGERDDRV